MFQEKPIPISYYKVQAKFFKHPPRHTRYRLHIMFQTPTTTTKLNQGKSCFLKPNFPRSSRDFITFLKKKNRHFFYPKSTCFDCIRSYVQHEWRCFQIATLEKYLGPKEKSHSVDALQTRKSNLGGILYSCMFTSKSKYKCDHQSSTEPFVRWGLQLGG